MQLDSIAGTRDVINHTKATIIPTSCVPSNVFYYSIRSIALKEAFLTPNFLNPRRRRRLRPQLSLHGRNPIVEIAVGIAEKVIVSWIEWREAKDRSLIGDGMSVPLQTVENNFKQHNVFQAK